MHKHVITADELRGKGRMFGPLRHLNHILCHTANTSQTTTTTLSGYFSTKWFPQECPWFLVEPDPRGRPSWLHSSAQIATEPWAHWDRGLGIPGPFFGAVAFTGLFHDFSDGLLCASSMDCATCVDSCGRSFSTTGGFEGAWTLNSGIFCATERAGGLGLRREGCRVQWKRYDVRSELFGA